MLQEIEGEFGNFCQDFISENFIRLKNNLNFSKNILSIAEQVSIEPLVALQEYIIDNPEEILDKSYLNKSFIIILTKLDDSVLSEFYRRIRNHTKDLICCKYGNFLIQELLQRNLPEVHHRI